MRAINTMSSEEYAERLSKSMRKMSKKIARLAYEQDYLMMQADNISDKEKTLNHFFNSQALFWAQQALTMSPDMIKRHMEMIRKREKRK